MFSPGTGNWSPQQSTPQKVKAGGALTYGNGTIYAFRGDKKKDFWKFDVIADSWSTLGSAPANVKEGGALVS